MATQLTDQLTVSLTLTDIVYYYYRILYVGHVEANETNLEEFDNANNDDCGVMKKSTSGRQYLADTYCSRTTQAVCQIGEFC